MGFHLTKLIYSPNVSKQFCFVIGTKQKIVYTFPTVGLPPGGGGLRFKGVCEYIERMVSRISQITG